MSAKSILHSIVASLLFLAASANASLITIDTPSFTVSTGQTYSVSATISSITDLYAFAFDLTFDPTLVAVTSVAEGAFLPTGGQTFFIAGTIDNVNGLVVGSADTLLGPVAGVTGSGTLATATVIGLNDGLASFTIANDIALDSSLNVLGPSPTNPIPEPATFGLALVALFASSFSKKLLTCKSSA